MIAKHSLCRAALLVAGALASLLTIAPRAQAASAWEIDARHSPSTFQAGGTASYSFIPNNVGETTSTGPVTIEIELPPGVKTRVVGADEEVGVTSVLPRRYWLWECPGTGVGGQSSVTCTSHAPVAPGAAGYLGSLTVFVEVEPGASGPLTATATATDGVEGATVADSAPVGAAAAAFGISPGTLLADVYDRYGDTERQAGSHPFRAAAKFDLVTANKVIPNFYDGAPGDWPVPLDSLRNVVVRLPAGFVGNLSAVAQCTGLQLSAIQSGGGSKCPVGSQVGTIQVAVKALLGAGTPPAPTTLPLYNMVPPEGTLAAFAFTYEGHPVYIVASLDPSDYSVVTSVLNIDETLITHYQKVTLWGVPGDPAHDSDRWNPEVIGWGAEREGPERPFLSLPTECGTPDVSEVTRLNSWQDPTVNVANGLATDPVTLNGCDQLEFEPTIVARPSTNLADSPAGLEFELHIPQEQDPKGLATAHLRDATVTLPAGMTVNPPSAAGLSACSMAQVGISAAGVPNGEPVSCPDASKLGTVEAVSPALDHPIEGTVYLAEQDANPFGSLLAMYLVLEDPMTGLLVKLPGRVDPDQSTGQLTATFRDNPQLPVEELRLKFFEGPRAALKTPSTCGTHTTDATFTPWTSPEGADAKKSSSFELTQGPSGGACPNGVAAAANNPAFSAGTVDPTAKAFSPFLLRLARADGTQQFKAIDTVLPKGLTAKLAGVPYCSDAALGAAAGRSGKVEQASPSCPAASRVGSVDVGAGAGSTPLYVQGQAYLAGPYKGAPLSLAIVTPAVAGPFDLGTVVVRTALQVNPETAQVRAVSDEIPQILQGIPLNIRSIALKMDRPEFMLNPTSCDPMSVDASALSVFGQTAPLSSRFQVGECNKLGFKPKLAIRFSGAPPRRGGHPKLSATLTMPPGGANIARAQVTMPKTEFLENAHIRTICTRVQYAAKACPKGSIYGYAKAWSPLLDQPLEGPVHLRSSSNKLPDLVASLDGQIHVDLVGRISSPNARIRNTFDLVPDAPVSKFVLTMQGGKKGLLVNSTNLCKAKPRASVQFDAQNGKVADSEPVVKVAGCGKKKRK